MCACASVSVHLLVRMSSKRKSHRLLTQCQSLQVNQSFPPIFTSQGEEMARRIERKQGAVSSSHPCLTKFLSYRRCIAQYTNNYLSKCSVTASRYRECLESTSEWEPPVQTSYLKMLHALGIFHKKKTPSISKLGAGSLIQFPR